jgi:hypothetical protein
MFQGPMTNMWAGLANADIPERGQWFESGFDGEVQPRRTLVKQTVSSGTVFIVECEIIASNHEAHLVGQRFSWVQKLDSVQVAMGAIKQFITAAMGFDPTDKVKVAELNPYYSQLMNSALADQVNAAGQNWLVRKAVHLTTKTIQKKRSAGLFTLHVWGLSTGQVGSWQAKAPQQAQPQTPTPAWPMQPQPQPQAPAWPMQPQPQPQAPAWPMQPQPQPQTSTPAWPMPAGKPPWQQ